MPQPMNGIVILVASPTDAAEERGTVRDALVDWNISRGRREHVALLPWLWERSAVAVLGDRPQALINRQAVDHADVVVAFFDSKLGSPTEMDVSGTAEEIARAQELGKPVHVYFSNEPLPRDVDRDQLAALDSFKKDLQGKGILGDYEDPRDLAGQVVRAIEHDIDRRGWGNAVAGTGRPPGARLTWRHVHEREQAGLDKRGKVTYRNTSNDLVVMNDGDRAAEDLTFEVAGVGDTRFVFPSPPVGPVTLTPGSEMSWLLIPTPTLQSSGNTVKVDAAWTENGEPQKGTWTVRLA